MLDNADIAWRVVHRARFALAALLAFGACRDTPTGPSELLGGVLLDERAATTSEGCALPWGCTIASTPTSEVIAAVAEATTIPFITGVATTGAPEQTAVVVAPDGGFPTDGSKYLVVSSGDARNPRWDGAWTWEPDWRDSAYGCACYPGTGDEATLTLTLALPPAAVAVEIDYRFFSADGAGLYHGPPWYEWSWIRLQTMTGTVLRETWGTGMVFTCPQFWPWRCIPDFWFPGGIQRLVADVRSVAGQAVQIQAYTADRGRHVQQQGILQSGVAIDGLRIVLGNLPPVANAGGPYVSDEGAVFQVDGSQSSDPEGGALTYAWDLDADGAFDDATSASVSRTFSDNGSYPIALRVTDPDGVSDTAGTTVTVRNVAPTVSVTGPSLVHPVLGSASVSVTVGFMDPGADTHTGTIDCDNGAPPVSLTSAGSPFEHSCTYTTSAFGPRTVRVMVTDDDGGSGSVAHRVSVLYVWSGFFPPVSSADVNTANAGRAVPLKFGLDGNQGLDIFPTSSPASRLTPCEGAPMGAALATFTPGNSGLTYDPGAQHYHYVWKTEKAWAGTCRLLEVRLADQTVHSVLFRFK